MKWLLVFMLVVGSGLPESARATTVLREERVLLPLTPEQQAANAALDDEIRRAEAAYPRQRADTEDEVRQRALERVDGNMLFDLMPCTSRTSPINEALDKLEVERGRHNQGSQQARPDWRMGPMPGYEKRRADLLRDREAIQKECEGQRQRLEIGRDRRITEVVAANLPDALKKLEREHELQLAMLEQRRQRPQTVLRQVVAEPTAQQPSAGGARQGMSSLPGQAGCKSAFSNNPAAHKECPTLALNGMSSKVEPARKASQPAMAPTKPLERKAQAQPVTPQPNEPQRQPAKPPSTVLAATPSEPLALAQAPAPRIEQEEEWVEEEEEEKAEAELDTAAVAGSAQDQQKAAEGVSLPARRAPAASLTTAILESPNKALSEPSPAQPRPALEASFDCARAVTPIEKSICRSPELAQLDREVAELFVQMLRTQSSSPEDFLQRHEQWLKHLPEVCPKADNTCLAKVYVARLIAMSKEAGSASKPASGQAAASAPKPSEERPENLASHSTVAPAAPPKPVLSSGAPPAPKSAGAVQSSAPLPAGPPAKAAPEGSVTMAELPAPMPPAEAPSKKSVLARAWGLLSDNATAAKEHLAAQASEATQQLREAQPARRVEQAQEAQSPQEVHQAVQEPAPEALPQDQPLKIWRTPSASQREPAPSARPATSVEQLKKCGRQAICTRDDFHRLLVGMTRTDVEAALGPPSGVMDMLGMLMVNYTELSVLESNRPYSGWLTLTVSHGRVNNVSLMVMNFSF